MIRRIQAILGLLIVLVSAGTVQAQDSARIRGFVTDAVDGESLVGVNVALRRDTVLVDGAATRTDGFYGLRDVPAGRYVITFSFIGYVSEVDTLRLAPGETRLLNVQLTAGAGALDEVVIEADRQAGITQARAGQITVRLADVERIPSPSVGGDLVNYLVSLPGVVTVGDRGGQLFIRGGEPWQNLVLLDGMWVYQPFHVLGFFSAFPAEILQSVDVYAGGFGSKYGGRISSVVDVSSREGSKAAFSGSLTLSPFVSGVFIEGPLIEDRISVVASLRESVIDQGAAQWVKEPLPYRFGDLFVKMHANVSDHGRLGVTILRTHDRGTIGDGVIGREIEGALQARPPDEVTWRNEAYGLRYVVLPRSFPVFGEFVVSASRLRTGLGNPGRPERVGHLASLNTSANLTHYAGPVDLTWGVFARTLEMESELSGQFQAFSFAREWVTEVGIYMEPSFRPRPDLSVTAGLRVHSFPSKSRTFLEPRVRAEWKRGNSMLSGAFGVYHQEIVGLSDRRDAANVFTVWSAIPYARVPRAIHAILGYSTPIASGISVSVEVYGKKLSDLFVPEWTAFPRFTTRLQPADGRVLGGDVRFELRKGPLVTTATYSLSSVRYTAQQSTLELWFGTGSYEYRPGHDRRHQLDLVSSLETDLVNVSLHWQFGSGLPFSRALGFDGFVLLDGPVDPFTETGSRRVIYEKPFNGILPTYHRLDISLERSFSMATGNLVVQVGAINAYGRRNLFYLDTFTLTRSDQLPFIPTFGIQYEFNR